MEGNCTNSTNSLAKVGASVLFWPGISSEYAFFVATRFHRQKAVKLIRTLNYCAVGATTAARLPAARCVALLEPGGRKCAADRTTATAEMTS